MEIPAVENEWDKNQIPNHYNFDFVNQSNSWKGKKKLYIYCNALITK